MSPITWTDADIIRFIGDDESVGIMQQDAEAARRAMDVMADAVLHGRTLNDVIAASRGEFSTDVCDRPALREKLDLVRAMMAEKNAVGGVAATYCGWDVAGMLSVLNQCCDVVKLESVASDNGGPEWRLYCLVDRLGEFEQEGPLFAVLTQAFKPHHAWADEWRENNRKALVESQEQQQ